MTVTPADCTESKYSNSLRKGLSAIAARKTGVMSVKSEAPIGKAEDAAAPKEISAAKCHAISFLTL